MIVLILTFAVGVVVGFKVHRLRIAIQNRIDPKEIKKLAIAIRRSKNARLAELMANVPDCSVCGPGIRHTNFEIV